MQSLDPVAKSGMKVTESRGASLQYYRTGTVERRRILRKIVAQNLRRLRDGRGQTQEGLAILQGLTVTISE
jgi:hypothetical protein